MISFRILPRSFSRSAACSLAALALAACGGDTTKTAVPADSGMAVSAELWKSRQKLADSVVRAAPAVSAVVKELGASRYDEADAELTAIVLKESEKTRDCYTKALVNVDPSLSMVLYVLVNFGAAGWDLVRIEKWNLSSPNGGVVVSCINARAKSEWKLPIHGMKPGAHLVKLVYRPDSTQKGAK